MLTFIEYLSRRTQLRRQEIIWRLKIVAILSCLVSLAICAAMWKTTTYIDSVTGSMKITEGAGSFTFNTHLTPTPLYHWVQKRDPTYKPQWRFLSSRNWFTRACGVACPIHRFQAWQNDFVTNSTDEDIAAFIRVMRKRTNVEQQKVIDATIQEITNNLEKRLKSSLLSYQKR